MKKLSTLTALLLALTLAAGAAFAAAKVGIKIKAEKEITTVKGGKKETRLIPAKKYAPNDLIVYTITYTNNGDQAATNAVIDDPIPAGTVYVPGSAKGEGSEITFSIDKGKTFAAPTLLTYETQAGGKKEKHVAAPEEYTNVRWVVATIPAKASGKLEFKVRVK
ncbi:hypothetical protein [Geomonas sp.]|uniref:hypothetical protein n=1 Tax=Geomonas sp. TaxID=2651584 RepID=UPI002B4895CF|nr:hypothetical protein [Geomonas sp.]HJV35335.1 hypothetical protein [Geomonas sp.]